MREVRVVMTLMQIHLWPRRLLAASPCGQPELTWAYCAMSYLPAEESLVLASSSANPLATLPDWPQLSAQAALMKIIQGQATQGPLRYLKRIKVDTVRLGKQQPAISSCTASTEAATGCVHLALPFSFEPGEGFSIMVNSQTPHNLTAALAQTTVIWRAQSDGRLNAVYPHPSVIRADSVYAHAYSTCLHRHDSSLTTAFDASFLAMQLALYVRPAKLLPAFATRVAVTSFSMKGDLRLSLHTSPDQAPGISSIGVSFAQPPLGM